MNRDAYSTPKPVFAVLNAEFNFAVDVAASRDNALCGIYFSEECSALERDWSPAGQNWAGKYAWCNPPYSDIGPWVAKAAEQSVKGIGTVMLVMMDQSVGWYKDAIQTCQEVRLVIGGRLSFIDPSTGKPAAGNNKGSMFIIWHPFGRTAVQYRHIERDEMLAAGRAILEQTCVSETAETETQPALAVESELKLEPEQTHNWPVEVKKIVDHALGFMRFQFEADAAVYNQLCEACNIRLISDPDGKDHVSYVMGLIEQKTKSEEQEEKSCTA